MGTLRVILAITVVIAHSGGSFVFKFTGPLVAVEVFFLISGFYMTMILNNKYVGKGSYRLFISNRFLRLYPIFWVILSLTIIISIVSFFVYGDWSALSPYIRYSSIISFETLLFQVFTNIALLGQDIMLFLGMNTTNGKMFFTSNFVNTTPHFWRFLLVPQAWTLSLEVMFYLIAPFIVRRKASIVASIILGSIVIRLFTYIYLDYSNDPWTYRFFPSELALFLLGTMSYKFHQLLSRKGCFTKKNCISVVAVYFLILIFYQYLPFNGSYLDHFFNWSFYLLTCLSLPYIFELSKSSHSDSRIGELSYPIYISHILVIIIITPLITRLGLLEYKVEFTILFTIIASYILVKFISDPLEKVRQSRVKVMYYA